jgi:hypothetical protein
VKDERDWQVVEVKSPLISKFQLSTFSMSTPTLSPDDGARQAEAIFALRDRLVRDLKRAKKGKVGSKVSTEEDDSTA